MFAAAHYGAATEATALNVSEIAMALLDQYNSLVAVRNAEVATYWTRYNVQSVLNTAILVAAISSMTGKRLGNLPIALVSLGGIALSFVWLSMVCQGKELIHRWDRQLAKFEEGLANEVYPLFRNIISEGAHESWRNMTAIAAIVPALFGIAWIVLWVNAYMCPDRNALATFMYSANCRWNRRAAKVAASIGATVARRSP